MGLRITTNLPSINAQKSMGATQREVNKSFAQLSSGSRITKAADDAAGLLRTAIRSKGLTLFMEPKALYNDPKAASVIPDDFEVPFGKARVRRNGEDLVMITYGNTTHMCLEAAERLSKEGVSAEVIDLLSLIPLDKETILNSVKKNR